MTMQNSNLTQPLTPLGRVPTVAEYNARVAKHFKTGTLTPEETALMKAADDMMAQQFLENLNRGALMGVETP